MNCPEELKRAYAAIKEVREALLELEYKLGEADASFRIEHTEKFPAGVQVYECDCCKRKQGDIDMELI